MFRGVDQINPGVKIIIINNNNKSLLKMAFEQLKN